MTGRAFRLCGIDYQLARVSEEELRRVASRTELDGKQMVVGYPYMFAVTADGEMLVYPELYADSEVQIVETENPG